MFVDVCQLSLVFELIVDIAQDNGLYKPNI